MSIETEIVLERVSTNKLNSNILDKVVNEIANATKNRQQANGVKSFIIPPEEPLRRPDGYFYTFKIKLVKDKYRNETAAHKSIEAAKKFVTKSAEARQWKVIGETQDIENQKAVLEYRPKFTVGELNNKVMEEYFSDIYERDAHIRIIHGSIENAILTNFEERNHILLSGQPAAAKTVLFMRFKKWYEISNPETERVAVINSTTLSKAGLETWLLEKAKDGLLPEILLFDEIEKFKLENLECLLQIMDGQAKISRINSKIGRSEAEAPVIIWATCNDVGKLKDFNNGALYSRFTKDLPCVRPSRELMHEILLKRIESRKIKGQPANEKWAKIIIDYSFDKMKTNDPRKIIAMLEGGDRLLDGSYFRDIEEIFRIYQESKKFELS